MRTIRTLTNEVGIWTVDNFDYLDTIGEGMLKQLGKLAEARLKYKQKTRKNKHTDSAILRELDFKVSIKDALADTMIFLLNWCFVKDIVLSENEARDYAQQKLNSELVALGLTLGALSQVFIMHDTNFNDDPILRRPYAQRIFNNLALCCKHNGWDFMKMLEHKWDKVSKRNWRRFPKDGLTK